MEMEIEIEKYVDTSYYGFAYALIFSHSFVLYQGIMYITLII